MTKYNVLQGSVKHGTISYNGNVPGATGAIQMSIVLEAK